MYQIIHDRAIHTEISFSPLQYSLVVRKWENILLVVPPSENKEVNSGSTFITREIQNNFVELNLTRDES